MARLSVSASVGEILRGERRLDATYYASAVYRARTVLDAFENRGGTTTELSTLSGGTYNPPPIKRIYTDDPNKGTPYMLPQEMFDFYWEPKKFVLADKMYDINSWFLKENWIVLTQSGTVGKPYLATEADAGIVLSQNAIRIPVDDSHAAGFLYTYLATWIGQTLLKRDEFGITVKHIRPHHVDAIRVPKIDVESRNSIGAKVVEAFRLRQEAIALIRAAKAQLLHALGAPDSVPLEDDEAPTEASESSLRRAARSRKTSSKKRKGRKAPSRKSTQKRR